MAVKRISPGDNLKDFDAYGTEDDEPVKNIKQPFKKFALGQGRGHKQEQSSQEEGQDGQDEASDEGSEAESYYLGFSTREEMDAFLKGKQLGERLRVC